MKASFSTVALLVFWVSTMAHASERCAPFLAALEAKTSRLDLLVDRIERLEGRYQNDVLVQRTIAAIREAKDGATRVIQSDDFTLHLSFAEKDGRLTVTIANFAQRGVRESTSPRPDQSQFPKALAGILLGLEARAAARPDLRRIDVVADHVRHPELAPLLRTLGFRDRLSPRVAVQTFALLGFAGLGLVAAPIVFADRSLLNRATAAAFWLAPLAALWLPAERRLRLRIDLPECERRSEVPSNGPR